MVQQIINDNDILKDLLVLDRDLSIAPVSPVVGDKYIVDVGATGVWAGHDGDIAVWTGAVWEFYTPYDGLTAVVADEDVFIKFNNGAWDTLLPDGLITSGLVNQFGDSGRFVKPNEVFDVIVSTGFQAPSYLNNFNGSSFAEYEKYVFNSSTYGGGAAALHTDVQELIEIMKNTTASRRRGPEFYTMMLTAGTGTAASSVVNGTTRYLAIQNREVPMWAQSTWGCWFKVLSGSAAIDYVPRTEFYLNGNEELNDFEILQADGWSQVIYVGKSALNSLEYDTGLFRLYAESGSEILMALPFLSSNQYRPKKGEIIGRVVKPGGWD